MAGEQLKDAANWIVTSKAPTENQDKSQIESKKETNQQVVEESYATFKIQQHTSSKQVNKEPIVNQDRSADNAVKCPYCDKGFRTAQQLNQHSVVHSGERKYLCDQEGCGKRFKQLSHLQQHKRLHTGERPYKCKIPGCDKAFTQQGNLNHHLSTATHDIPSDFKDFSLQCESDTVNKGNGVSVECDVCGLPLPTVEHFEVHREQTHPEFVSLRELIFGSSARKRGRPKATENRKEHTPQPEASTSANTTESQCGWPPLKSPRYASTTNTCTAAASVGAPVFPSMFPSDSDVEPEPEARDERAIESEQKPLWVEDCSNKGHDHVVNRMERSRAWQGERCNNWHTEKIQNKNDWSVEKHRDWPKNGFEKPQDWSLEKRNQSSNWSERLERPSHFSKDRDMSNRWSEERRESRDWVNERQEKPRDWLTDKQETAITALLRHLPESVQQLLGAEVLNLPEEEKHSFLMRVVEKGMNESQRRAFLALLSPNRSTPSPPQAHHSHHAPAAHAPYGGHNSHYGAQPFSEQCPHQQAHDYRRFQSRDPFE